MTAAGRRMPPLAVKGRGARRVSRASRRRLSSSISRLYIDIEDAAVVVRFDGLQGFLLLLLVGRR